VTGFAHGLVIGKFYPPHAGHEHLVRIAAAGARRVTVVVMSSAADSIPLAERVRWMRAIHADGGNVHVTGLPCDIPFDLGDRTVWAAQVAGMRAAVQQVTSEPLDAVFTSEEYGDELAARLGATHVCVDPQRVAVPVSATACRADLAGLWDRLHPVVRAGLAVRIVVVGAESTGTTTLSRALAEHYRARGGVWARTGWVHEHGRDYTVTKWDEQIAAARAAGRAAPGMDELVWTADDFAVIATRQTELEDAAAAAGSPVLVCDTDAFATSVWERRYLGADTGAAAASPLPRRDVYLLTDHVDVPFVQDGIRDGEHIRVDMTGWFVTALTRAGHSWVLLTGTREERLRLAVRVTDLALERRARFTAPHTPHDGKVLA
jgi:NadR type nicotinamide-nucleotide adenylyltransferase